MGSGPQAPPPLPIDSVLDELVAALRRCGRAVLLAPPGAGKTTRVPPAVLASGLADQVPGGVIYVLEPRRLAARMAAARVAGELGQEVGQTVGYEVRFDRRVGPETRIRFVTEGVLLRKLASDPELVHAAAVIIDEFHERHLAGDLALAMIRTLRRGARPDLLVVVMSATMEPEPIARFLADDDDLALESAPIVESRGRVFPVAIEYMLERRSRERDGLPLERQVSAALRGLVRGGLDGDVLVFLPGAAEIRAAMEACADIARAHGLRLLPLHGDLPAREQDLAVAPSTQPKVVLATNVAETSITIDGVVCVIDSGLARRARHSPWSGLPSLKVEAISQASAAQRAGRAGRTRAGRCIRLYHQHEHDHWRPFEPPDVERADLADAALFLHAAGVARLADFTWFEAPPEASMTAADALLAALGAIDERGALTSVGRRMMRFPVHPRHGRILVEAEERGVARAACTLVAVLGQREIRLDRRTRLGPGAAKARAVSTGPSDVIEDLDALAALDEARAGSSARAARGHGLDPVAVAAVRRVEKRLRALCRESRGSDRLDEVDEERALLLATLTGYPDRVARRRAPGAEALVFAGGGSGVLAATSVVREAEFLVALEAREGGRSHGRDRGAGGHARVVVTRASAIDPAWLFDLYIDDMSERDELEWNAASERVERVSEIAYHGLVIDSTRDVAAARLDPEGAAELLAAEALRAGIERFVDADAWHAWRARRAFVRAQRAGSDGEAGIPDPEDELRRAFAGACQGLASFAELRRVSLLDSLDGRMSRDERDAYQRLAPTHVSLPGRKRVPVHYELDRPPWIESRLQDFFGLSKGPSVAMGRVPLVLHLLAPNRRAVQVTSDLPGFFERHYPAIRRQLMRRYPKHAWPEDPTQAGSR